jgi:hypothetical protein
MSLFRSRRRRRALESVALLSSDLTWRVSHRKGGATNCGYCGRRISKHESDTLAACHLCHAQTQAIAPSLVHRWPCGCEPRGLCDFHNTILKGNES